MALCRDRGSRPSPGSQGGEVALILAVSHGRSGGRGWERKWVRAPREAVGSAPGPRLQPLSPSLCIPALPETLRICLSL